MARGQLSYAAKSYMLAYNTASAIAWGYIFFSLVTHLLSGNSYTTFYGRIEHPLTVITIVAILEIFHAALGLVNSGVGATATQVLARLFIIWNTTYMFPKDIVVQCFGFTVMTFAWSITECIRYPYYALSLLEVDFYPILWARYSLFFALYPLGVWGEITQVIRSLDFAYEKSPIMYYFLVFMMILYLPSFNTLYRYMIKQRAKYIGSVNSQVKDTTAKLSTGVSKTAKAKKL